MEFYDLNFCNSIKDLNRIDIIKNDIELLQNKNKEQTNILMSYNIKTEVECIKNKNDIKIINFKLIKYAIKIYFNKKEINLGECKILENNKKYNNKYIIKNYNKKIYNLNNISNEINNIDKNIELKQLISKLYIKTLFLSKKYKYLINYIFLQKINNIDKLWNLYYLNLKKEINLDINANKKNIDDKIKASKENMKIKLKNNTLTMKNTNMIAIIEKNIKHCKNKDKKYNELISSLHNNSKNIFSHINTNNNKIYKLEKIISDIEYKYNNISTNVKQLCTKIKNEICAICIENIDSGIITSCGHKYHIECINLYVDSVINKPGTFNLICPICRKNIN